MRVAIVGGGVAGCSCAWQLANVASNAVSVTIFEMGRGAGGRASTRRSRELPGLALSHGAPLFHLRHGNAAAASLVSALVAAGSAAKWNGSCGRLDAATGSTGPGRASRGEPPEGQEPFQRFVGTPGMSSLADGILKLADEGVVRTRYGVKVQKLRRTNPVGPSDILWELTGKDGEVLGEFDWLVVTSATMAHPRWRQSFGEEPPMEAAARGSSPLRQQLQKLQELRFSPLHVAMLVWSVPADAEVDAATHALSLLPFDVTEVVGDEVLSKVVRQSLGPPFAAVVLHSTSTFAERYAKVYGSTSTTARLGTSVGSCEDEALVAGKLHEAFEKLLTERLGAAASALPPPTWGPVLHRWGSAFPEREGSVVAEDGAVVVPDAKVVLAGDFLAHPYATVEGAIASGIEGANGILTGSGFSPSGPAG